VHEVLVDVVLADGMLGVVGLFLFAPHAVELVNLAGHQSELLERLAESASDPKLPSSVRRRRCARELDRT
jgi:hypothetical protein